MTDSPATSTISKPLLKAAKSGDIQAPKLILDRTLAAPKHAAKALTLPRAGAGEPPGKPLGACPQGNITRYDPSPACTISGHARVIQLVELTQRVDGESDP